MKKKIYLTLFIITLVTGLITYGIYIYPKSHGTRSGKLVRITKKGVFYKTYEGTLDLGSGDELTWKFSVHDRELGERLTNQAGKYVSLEYRELFFKFFYETTFDVMAWKLEGNSQDTDYLCRLVNIIQKNSSVVEYLRKNIETDDYELLSAIKRCKNY